jgi:hypothetical protein
LQGPSFNSCLIQLSRGAGGRGEAFNLIALPFRGAADDRERTLSLVCVTTRIVLREKKL